MTDNQPAPPAAPNIPDREREAVADIEATSLTPAAKWVLSAGFLALIVGVPVLQSVVDVVRHARGERASAVPGPAGLVAVPGALEGLWFGDGSPAGRVARAWRAAGAAIARWETDLEQDSLPARVSRPWVQAMLTPGLGAGGTNVFRGHEGTLFLREELTAGAGPAMLAPAVLDARRRRRLAHGGPAAPDPRPAIVRFHEKLAGRGVRLLLVIVPDRPTVLPEWTGVKGPGRGAENPSAGRLRADLALAGVEVLDLLPEFEALAPDLRRAAYLRTDTHWRPEGMELAARTVAERLKRDLPALPAERQGAWSEAPTEVTFTGELARMLDLPPEVSPYPVEKVVVRSVSWNGVPLQPQAGADVLVMGDSFVNMYADPSLHAGTAGGVAERLAWHLCRPVDVLARNGGGSDQVRRELAAELARGQDRLAGKSVVVWVVPGRAFATADWPVVDLPAPRGGSAVRPPDPGPNTPTGTGEGWTATVTATVAAVSPVPDPGKSPYADHILSLHVKGVRTLHGSPPKATPGGAPATEMVCLLYSMRDRKLLPAAALRPGATVTLRVRPWADVAGRLGRINRSDPDDPELALLDPWWAEPAE